MHDDVIIDPDELTFDGRSFRDVDVGKLQATCLMHMTRFVAEPSPMQAAIVAAMLEALSRHEDHHVPPCGCDVYAQARGTWLGLAARMQAGAGPKVRH